jgi:predicted metal-dependent HD superfamily phosphohydrolase
MPSAVLLAQHSNLPKHEIRLLEVAAAYHDMGFIFTCTGHEQISIEIMSQSLPAYGFGLQEMEQIAGMIRATQLPQSPHNLLEQILADADLDILGRENFFERNKALWQELMVCGEPVPWDEWLESQVQFLKNHTYFTPAARALRDTTKQKHIAALEKQIHQNL